MNGSFEVTGVNVLAITRLANITIKTIQNWRAISCTQEGKGHEYAQGPARLIDRRVENFERVDGILDSQLEI